LKRARAEPGSEEIISNLENQTIFVGGRNIKFKDDPTGWIMGLPEFYNGSALRAHMAQEAPKKRPHSKRSRAESPANTDDKPVTPVQEPKMKVFRGMTITDATEPGRAFIMPWNGPIPNTQGANKEAERPCLIRGVRQ